MLIFIFDDACEFFVDKEFPFGKFWCIIFKENMQRGLSMYNLYGYLAMFGIFLLVIVIAATILLLVTNWKIFSKAGKPGWGALIPFYNMYVMSDIAFGNASYFIGVMVLWLLSVFGRIFEIGFLRGFSGLGSLVLYVIYCIKISKAFGKSGGFTVGLVLLPLIFFPILAFGSAEYIGPQTS